MYACVYVCICMCACVCACECACVFVCRVMCVHLYEHACTCMHADIGVRVCVAVVCMYVRRYIIHVDR